MRRRRTWALVAVLLVGGACSPDPSAGGGSTPVAPPLAPSVSAPVSASPTTGPARPTPPVGTRPVVDCLNGTYRLTGFSDATPGAAYVDGRGGDVRLVFSGEELDDGNYAGTRYRLEAGGAKGVTLTAPDGSEGSLVVRAKAAGFYTLESDQAVFDRGGGSGSARLTGAGAGAGRTLTLAEVQELVTPIGTTTVSCTRTTLWLTGDTRQLVLTAV